MAKKKNRRKAKKKPAIIPIVSVVAPPVLSAAKSLSTGQGWEGVGVNLMYGYTGWDATNNKWDANGMGNILLPTAIGLGISMVGKKLKLNRYVPDFLPFNLF